MTPSPPSQSSSVDQWKRVHENMARIAELAGARLQQPGPLTQLASRSQEIRRLLIDVDDDLARLRRQ